MSMLAPFACGARNRPGVAAKAALRPRVFLRKSRLFFMDLPLRSWRTQLSPRDSMDIGSKRDARPSNRHQVAAVAIPLLRRRGGNSDAKDGKRRSMYRARSGRPAVQTPYGVEI